MAFTYTGRIGPYRSLSAGSMPISTQRASTEPAGVTSPIGARDVSMPSTSSDRGSWPPSTRTHVVPMSALVEAVAVNAEHLGCTVQDEVTIDGRRRGIEEGGDTSGEGDIVDPQPYRRSG